MGGGGKAADQLVEVRMGPLEIAVSKADAPAVAHECIQLVGDGREVGHSRIRKEGRGEAALKTQRPAAVSGPGRMPASRQTLAD